MAGGLFSSLSTSQISAVLTTQGCAWAGTKTWQEREKNDRVPGNAFVNMAWLSLALTRLPGGFRGGLIQCGGEGCRYKLSADQKQ